MLLLNGHYSNIIKMPPLYQQTLLKKMENGKTDTNLQVVRVQLPTQQNATIHQKTPHS